MTRCLAIATSFTLGLLCLGSLDAGRASCLAAWQTADAVPSAQGQDQDQKTPSRPLAEVGPKPLPVEPPTAEAIDAAISRGVEFLLKVQNKDGSWGTAEQTKDLNIYAPVPGAHHAFRSAVTGLCVAALLDVQSSDQRVTVAIDRGEKWLLENLPSLRRATGDALYNIWGHAYGIEALARLHSYRTGDEAKQSSLRAEMIHQIELLGRYESVHGGWGYYDFAMQLQKPSSDPNSFTTATVLYAFHLAQGTGVSVPKKLIDRGLDVIRRQQRPDLGYLYSENFLYRTGADINKPGGSVGRSQACNLVLRLYGDKSVTDEAIATWANRLFARNLWLDIGRKRPVPHEAWYQVAGYFFYYGHYYAGLCIEHAPADQQKTLRDQLAHVMISLQEKDGSWWDYPLYNYHQQYGTAFALMTLKRCK
ncbi:MAG: prenyltransferase/squalene oxidase repeat-containing protein [Planctomycetota bacterium]